MLGGMASQLPWQRPSHSQDGKSTPALSLPGILTWLSSVKTGCGMNTKGDQPDHAPTVPWHQWGTSCKQWGASCNQWEGDLNWPSLKGSHGVNGMHDKP